MSQKVQIYCNRCEGFTWHSIAASFEQSFTPETYPSMQIDYAAVTYEVLVCDGCEDGSFRETSWTSEDSDPETGEIPGNVEIYPPRTQGTREPRPYRNLPDTLKDLYQDVVRAHNANMPLLCAAGLRALVEGLCKDQRVTSGQVKVKTKSGPALRKMKDLRGRIEGLAQKGLLRARSEITCPIFAPGGRFSGHGNASHGQVISERALTPRDAKILHGLRFMGNEAVHELQAPPLEQVKTALDVKV